MAAKKFKKKKAKKNNSTVLGILVLLFCTLVLASFAYFYKTQTKALERDVNGCLKNTASEHRIILFDKSDALNAVQKRSVKTHFDNLIFGSPVNTLFSIYVLDANVTPNTKLLLKRCKPKSGQEANVLTENERLVEKKWQSEFVSPLGDVTNLLLIDNPSNTSPIMEAIQSVSLDNPIRNAQNGKVSLTVVSDMIQNTAGLNQYNAQTEFSSFVQSSYFQSVRSDLGGIDVEILYVGRAGRSSIQTNKHGNFWADYFDAMDSTLQRIERIIGE